MNQEQTQEQTPVSQQKQEYDPAWLHSLVIKQRISLYVWLFVSLYQLIVGLSSICASFYGFFMVCLGLFNLVRFIVICIRYPKLEKDQDRMILYWSNRLVGLIFGIIFNVCMGGIVGGAAAIYDFVTCIDVRTVIKLKNQKIIQ